MGFVKVRGLSLHLHDDGDHEYQENLIGAEEQCLVGNISDGARVLDGLIGLLSTS